MQRTTYVRTVGHRCACASARGSAYVGGGLGRVGVGLGSANDVRGAGYVTGEVSGKRAVQFHRRRCDLMQLTDLYPRCHRRYSSLAIFSPGSLVVSTSYQTEPALPHSRCCVGCGILKGSVGGWHVGSHALPKSSIESGAPMLQLQLQILALER